MRKKNCRRKWRKDVISSGFLGVAAHVWIGCGREGRSFYPQMAGALS